MIAVDYRDGEVTGDAGRVEIPLGAEVTLTVTSDVADEVHLHGYDESVPVQPGQPATLRFTADIPGVFEFELEQTGARLGALQVQ